MVSKMRRQSLISLIFISLILVPGVVQAATWEYITYGGYDAAIKAWKLVALILSDRNYNGLIISAAVLGAICIFVATYIKIATGAKTGGLSWAVPVLAGLTLYAALVVPKDSLVIYDEKLNRGPYQIDGIPRGIATLAGILNKIEIGMIEIFSTSVDPASDYRLNSGGTGWEVIDYADPVMLSANLRQTLYNYIKDCVFVELARPGTILDADKIASGEQKYDTVITESRNPSLYTVKYDSSNPNGVSATCTEVGNYLIGVMNNPATWEEAFKNACAARGFDVTVPASYNQCKTLIESTLAKTFKDSNSVTIPLFGAQRTLGKELQNVIFSSAPSVSISRLASTNTMSQFIGLAVHANSWLPVIKESLMAIAVSAIPLLTLFIVTPLVGRALSIIAGLFVWLTLWGVIDAIIHGLGVTLAEDSAAAMSFGRRVDVGLAQVLSYPGYAAKVAATFGGLRWSGLMIASVITAMIIRFGGTALAMLAGSIASLPQGSGQQYGVSAIRNPEGIFKSEILPATTIGGKLWAAGGADNYAKGLQNMDIGTDVGRAMAGNYLGSDKIAKATAGGTIEQTTKNWWLWEAYGGKGGAETRGMREADLYAARFDSHPLRVQTLSQATGKTETLYSLGRAEAQGMKVETLGNGIGKVHLGSGGPVVYTTPKGNLALLSLSSPIGSSIQDGVTFRELSKAMQSNRVATRFMNSLTNKWFDSNSGEYRTQVGEQFRNTFNQTFGEKIAESQALKNELGFQNISQAKWEFGGGAEAKLSLKGPDASVSVDFKTGVAQIYNKTTGRTYTKQLSSEALNELRTAYEQAKSSGWDYVMSSRSGYEYVLSKAREQSGEVSKAVEEAYEVAKNRSYSLNEDTANAIFNSYVENKYGRITVDTVRQADADLRTMATTGDYSELWQYVNRPVQGTNPELVEQRIKEARTKIDDGINKLNSPLASPKGSPGAVKPPAADNIRLELPNYSFVKDKRESAQKLFKNFNDIHENLGSLGFMIVDTAGTVLDAPTGLLGIGNPVDHVNPVKPKNKHLSW